jgi:hypothetical protein
MPYSSTWENRCVRKRFTGLVSARDFVQSAQEIAAHPQFDRLRAIINDFTDASGSEVDAAALMEVAIMRIGSRSTNSALCVLVIGHAPWVIDLVSAVSAKPLVGSHDTRRFDTCAQAVDWLSAQSPRALNRGVSW